VSWTSTVVEYADELRRLGREQFVVSYPAPLLLHRLVSAATPTRPSKFRTDLPHGQRDEVLVGDASDLEVAVHAIRKRPASPYEDTVTIGRAAENDIVLPYRDVSKLHAYFTRGADGGLRIHDNGSSNGTWLAGARLPANEPRALGARDRFALGGYTFELFLPDAFAAWLAERG
jgi:hypothetical protein